MWVHLDGGSWIVYQFLPPRSRRGPMTSSCSYRISGSYSLTDDVGAICCHLQAPPCLLVLGKSLPLAEHSLITKGDHRDWGMRLPGFQPLQLKRIQRNKGVVDTTQTHRILSSHGSITVLIQTVWVKANEEKNQLFQTGQALNTGM